jgi:hypothetical protein
MGRRIAALAGLLLLASPGAPAADETATRVAVQAAETWLRLVDRGEYGSSWDAAAALFKGAMTRAQWEGALTGSRKPLGRLASRTLQTAQYATSLPGAPDGRYVVIQFRTSFEHKASAVETVTPMLDRDGTWRVSGYYIR